MNKFKLFITAFVLWTCITWITTNALEPFTIESEYICIDYTTANNTQLSFNDNNWTCSFSFNIWTTTQYNTNTQCLKLPTNCLWVTITPQWRVDYSNISNVYFIEPFDENMCEPQQQCEEQTCPTCQQQYTSLECQTNYNLIPIADVTANYCKINHDLIEATECPNIWEWTWDVQRTARYINNQQYPWTSMLHINIADFLQWHTTYNESETIIDVVWVDADEEYINWIINKTQMTPTAEDMWTLVNGLQAFIPYLFIWLLMAYTIVLINKLFKW